MLTKEVKSSFQYDTERKLKRWVDSSGKPEKEWESANDYVYTAEEWFSEADIGAELLPFFSFDLVEFINRKFDFNNSDYMPSYKPDVHLGVMRLLPKAYKRYLDSIINEFKEELKKLNLLQEEK